MINNHINKLNSNHEKKLLLIALAAMPFITMPDAHATTSHTQPATEQMTDDGLYYGYIKQEGGYTNVRKTPGGAATLKIKDGTAIFYSPTDGNWWYVYDTDINFLGFVHRSKIVSTEQPTYIYGHIKQEGGYTNIRKSPNGAIAIKIKDGTKIYYVRTSSDWWKVFNTNYSFLGYVHRSKIIKD